MPRCKRCRRSSNEWTLRGKLCPTCYDEVHKSYRPFPDPRIKLTREQAHILSDLIPGFQANQRSISHEEWSKVRDQYREIVQDRKNNVGT